MQGERMKWFSSGLSPVKLEFFTEMKGGKNCTILLVSNPTIIIAVSQDRKQKDLCCANERRLLLAAGP